MSSEASSAASRRLLHMTIDEIAAKTPERVWGSIPRSANLSDGYRDISYVTFANAINRLAWFLQSKLGKSSMFETVAYIGKSSGWLHQFYPAQRSAGLPDMRYHIMCMAAAKTGYQASTPCNR